MDANKPRLDDEFLDRLLDAGLERMKHVEARARLEERILARIAAAKPRFDWRQWPLRAGVGLAAVALIIAGAYLSRRPRDLHSTAVASAGRNPAIRDRRYRAAPASTASEIAGSHGQGISDRGPAGRAQGPTVSHKTTDRGYHLSAVPSFVRASSDRGYSAPRLPVFPSPAPLTEQEKILLSLRNPEQVLVALAQSQNSTSESGPAPLVIKPIEIKPLDGSPNGSQESNQSDGTSNQEAPQTDGWN